MYRSLYFVSIFILLFLRVTLLACQVTASAYLARHTHLGLSFPGACTTVMRPNRARGGGGIFTNSIPTRQCQGSLPHLLYELRLPSLRPALLGQLSARRRPGRAMSPVHFSIPMDDRRRATTEAPGLHGGCWSAGSESLAFQRRGAAALPSRANSTRAASASPPRPGRAGNAGMASPKDDTSSSCHLLHGRCPVHEEESSLSPRAASGERREKGRVFVSGWHGRGLGRPRAGVMYLPTHFARL